MLELQTIHRVDCVRCRLVPAVGFLFRLPRGRQRTRHAPDRRAADTVLGGRNVTAVTRGSKFFAHAVRSAA
jgi:hypothetical protein